MPAAAAAAEDRLDRHAADVRRVQRPLEDEPDLVVVDPERRRHGEGREDAPGRQPVDGVVLEPADVGTAVVRRGLGGVPVVLQVDLEPLAVLGQQVEQGVVAGDQQPVGVEEDADDGAAGHLVEQLGEVGVERRLAAGEHEYVDPSVLAGEPGVDRGEHLVERRHARQCRRRLGEAGRALEVAVVEQVLEQDAGVLRLHLRQPVLVGRGHRLEVAEPVGGVDLRRRGPLLEVGEDLG